MAGARRLPAGPPAGPGLTVTRTVLDAHTRSVEWHAAGLHSAGLATLKLR